MSSKTQMNEQIQERAATPNNTRQMYIADYTKTRMLRHYTTTRLASRNGCRKADRTNSSIRSDSRVLCVTTQKCTEHRTPEALRSQS